MRILFVGDVIGKPGRKILATMLPRLVDRKAIDYVIVNVENAAGGYGVTREVLAEFDELPIDCYSSGNHIWDRKEAIPLLANPKLLRPENYPLGNPGSGLYIGETAAGHKVATLNLEGQVFMKGLRSPFLVADEVLSRLPRDVKTVIVDFHAEATSEKQALGYHLAGRVAAVFGTHTHVPTADDRILPGGTAFITDVGMTGPYDGVIGFRHDKVLHRFLTQTPAPFEVAKNDVRLAGALVDVDPETGRATALERLLICDGQDF
jgi:metallophosphoesterase (TIGR00282 family)